MWCYATDSTLCHFKGSVSMAAQLHGWLAFLFCALEIYVLYLSMNLRMSMTASARKHSDSEKNIPTHFLCDCWAAFVSRLLPQWESSVQSPQNSFLNNSMTVWSLLVLKSNKFIHLFYLKLLKTKLKWKRNKVFFEQYIYTYMLYIPNTVHKGYPNFSMPRPPK